METTTQIIGIEEVPATPGSAAKLIREVRAKTRRQFSAEDRIARDGAEGSGHFNCCPGN